MLGIVRKDSVIIGGDLNLTMKPGEIKGEELYRNPQN